MAKPPAVVIVVRHGARLDAADRTWHLTSPTPYDPPLTYGGWTQSIALGARIASLLHAREESFETKEDEEQDLSSKNFQKLDKRKRRKHRVIVHSSPFARCLQTSIAISAGLSQYPWRERYPPRTPPSGLQHQSSLGSCSENPSLDMHQTSETDVTVSSRTRPMYSPGGIVKTTLRVDAFLGEWLTPDYFEAITPPPSSAMMLASAKARLLRPCEPIPTTYVSFSSKGHFPGGWSRGPGPVASSSKEDSPLQSISSLTSALPHARRERASSHSSIGSTTSARSGPRMAAMTSAKGDYARYVPPIPNYAVSPLDPIPTGYVGDAREACVKVDLAWDSMREPQDWPSGGELGEEWSAMHKRFRKGLDDLIKWYMLHGTASPQNDSNVGDENPEEELDEDTDLVVILVTHGAGCNALIGGLTNHPALLDVGMASLTVAVRKDHQTPSSTPALDSVTSSPPESRRSSLDLSVSKEYELRIVASLDHIRSGFSPRSPSTPSIPPIPEYRGSSPSSLTEAQPHEHAASANSALGSVRRSSLSGTSRSYAGDRPGLRKAVTSLGLWGGKHSPRTSGPGPDDPSALIESEDESTTPPTNQIQPTVNQFGLWGGANVSGSRNERVIAPKRRWTVTERDS